MTDPAQDFRHAHGALLLFLDAVCEAVGIYRFAGWLHLVPVPELPTFGHWHQSRTYQAGESDLCEFCRPRTERDA